MYGVSFGVLYRLMCTGTRGQNPFEDAVYSIIQ